MLEGLSLGGKWRFICMASEGASKRQSKTAKNGQKSIILLPKRLFHYVQGFPCNFSMKHRSSTNKGSMGEKSMQPSCGFNIGTGHHCRWNCGFGYSYGSFSIDPSNLYSWANLTTPSHHIYTCKAWWTSNQLTKMFIIS